MSLVLMDQWQWQFSNISLQEDLEQTLPDHNLPDPDLLDPEHQEAILSATVLEYAGWPGNASTLHVAVHSYVFVDDCNKHLKSARRFFIFLICKNDNII